MARRWLVAAAGTVLMACLGTVYAWSLFTQPLAAGFGWSSARTTAPFAAAIFFLGVGAIVGGRWQDRAGPRPVAITGALLWGLGNLLAGLGTARFGSAWLVATFGVVGGLGLGLGYVTPVAAVTKWFPDKRGLGSGLVVMGFGLGAFFHANLLKSLPAFAAVSAEAAAIVRAGTGALSPASIVVVMTTFTVSGVVFLLLGGAAATLVADPPPGLALPAPKPSAAVKAGAGPDLAPAQALRRPQFWSLWAMLFLNVTAGILFISNAVPILRELTGATPAAAAAVYGAIAVANGIGRFLWGAVSDRIGRRAAYVLIYGIQVVIFLAATRVHALGAAAALFAVVLLCYGGGFGTMPSFVADWFGTRHLGVNYGWILSAWGVAGVAGPLFVATVKDLTGSYAGALPWIAGLLACAALLPAVTRRPDPS
jgi:MFS family permease